MLAPVDKSTHQISGIEHAAGHQAFTECQRHRRVIGPLARFQAKRTTADHVDEAGQRVAGRELQCRPNRVPNGKTD